MSEVIEIASMKWSLLLVVLVGAAYAYYDDEGQPPIPGTGEEGGNGKTRKICGSDGTIYDSREAFRNQICTTQNYELTWKPMACCENDSENEGNAANPRGRGKRGGRRGGKRGGNRGGKKRCDAKERRMENFSVCGTDSVTYTAMADFKKARCDNVDLRMVFKGKCGECDAIKCVRRRPRQSGRGRGRGGNNKRRRTICGSDGNEYQSMCEFTKAKCNSLKAGNLITAVRKVAGKCPEAEE